ncbi:uncharacterized protein LTR77_002973 [Saxophila tyrrhenica]|uniref:Uncharacterized protein n=1 Tax=Saxophila tyrrhenica TaxID=1690608 RepID=A0AAV9PKC6_9PEZI|nr:hypothetical protein LTR77_002973 [Saxophila tyrrhenica]
MAASFQPEREEEVVVAEKVLRRAQVSKMTRALQDRLALANVKIQNGWQDMSLDLIEAQVDERRRKRPASSNDTISDTASTVSSRLQSSNGGMDSSPLTAPMYSDDFQRSGSGHSNKRLRTLDVQKFRSSSARTGRRAASGRQALWKRRQGLPESSPIKHEKHARCPSTNFTQLSFISEGSTIPDEPPSPEFSEDDDADLPVHSFSINSSTRITSSPPRTPPPDRRMRKAHNVSWSRTPKTGEEGVDLLMYLATSPGYPKGSTAKTVVQAPSTPPAKATPLPSSHMTPGMGGAGFAFGPNTPGTNFNFADFVNVTPSPAQGSFNRTPNVGRTPAAAREARRKLNFDNLVPPSSSPVMTRSGSRNEGLGMELGGELVSSQ